MTKAEYNRKRLDIEDLWMTGLISSSLREVMQHELLLNYSKAQAETEDDSDPVTARLMEDALKTHGLDSCPKCGNRGVFIRMALVCPWHGAWGGC